MLVERRHLILKKIPHVLANFFESSDKWNLQLRFSSHRRPKSLTYLAFVKSFLPILIDISVGIFIVVVRKIISLVLLILRRSLFTSNHLFIYFNSLFTIYARLARVSQSQ